MHTLRAIILTLISTAALADDVVVDTAAGRHHHFTVEMADNDKQRQTGLMFRRSLAPDAGMLFDFGTEQPISMWMKNTLIPLDMLFIAEDGRIVSIAERTTPGSLSQITAPTPIRSVLELNGGTAAQHGIKPGDLVRHRTFNTTPARPRSSE